MSLCVCEFSVFQLHTYSPVGGKSRGVSVTAIVKPCDQLRLSSVNSRHFVLFLDTCVARTGEKVTINALNDQWINGH